MKNLFLLFAVALMSLTIACTKSSTTSPDDNTNIGVSILGKWKIIEDFYQGEDYTDEIDECEYVILEFKQGNKYVTYISEDCILEEEQSGEFYIDGNILKAIELNEDGSVYDTEEYLFEIKNNILTIRWQSEDSYMKFARM